MYTMQSFYASLTQETALAGFLRIARASLQEIWAVRSDAVWEVWTESK